MDTALTSTKLLVDRRGNEVVLVDGKTYIYQAALDGDHGSEVQEHAWKIAQYEESKILAFRPVKKK
jgi:hypothetical protein